MFEFWDSLAPAWQACLEEAWSAWLEGSVPVGAVVTTPQGEILARGRNRVNDPEQIPRRIGHHPLAHAELNALLAVDLLQQDPHPLVLYTSMEPCPLCLGAVYMSGLRTVYFAARDPYAGSANLLGTTPYLSVKPVRICGPQNPLLENLLIAIHTVKALEYSQANLRPLLDACLAVVPQGTRLGLQLANTGELAAMRQSNLPAREAFQRLASRLVED